MNFPLKDQLGHVLEISVDDIVFKPKQRHDFVYLFDATRCNPNGDPDNDNLPRQDLEDQHGFTTDVCQKRKLRRFVGDLYGTARENKEGGMNLFAKHRGLLGKEKRSTRKLLEQDSKVAEELAKKKTAADRDKYVDGLDTEFKQGFFRKTYWDVRMFGAVLTTGKGEQEDDLAAQAPEATEESNSDAPAGSDGGSTADLFDTVVSKAEEGAPRKGKATDRAEETQRKDPLKAGQCVGPLQINYAVTIEPITTDLVSIASSALPSNKPKKEDSISPSDGTDPESEEARSGTFGNKPITPYGLYRGEGQYAPMLDKRRNFDGKLDANGFVTSEDLAVVWNGLRQMFNDDASASRPAGSMKALAAWVFTHDHPRGNYPLHKLHELIKVVRDEDVKPKDEPAREYADYKVEFAWKELPDTVLVSQEEDSMEVKAEGEEAAKGWVLKNRRLFKDGKEIGVTVTELYNDWRD